jgi:protein TonB
LSRSVTDSDGARDTPSIAEAVLATGARQQPARRSLGLSLAFALGAHVGLWALATQLGPAQLAPPTKPPDLEVAMDEPPPPPVVEKEPDPPALEPPPSSARAKAPAKAPRASAPAQASTIIARQPDPNAPLDFSGDAFVTGTASAYAGGATASSGTSTHAVTRVATQPNPAPAAPPLKAVSLSRAVSLAQDEWQCPWPHEAELAEIDAQTVTMRVRVDADGRVRKVTLIEDPGSGFGAAARACALATRFSPALDREGNVTSADSPPIRVRFTR